MPDVGSSGLCRFSWRRDAVPSAVKMSGCGLLVQGYFSPTRAKSIHDTPSIAPPDKSSQTFGYEGYMGADTPILSTVDGVRAPIEPHGRTRSGDGDGDAVGERRVMQFEPREFAALWKVVHDRARHG